MGSLCTDCDCNVACILLKDGNDDMYTCVKTVSLHHRQGQKDAHNLPAPHGLRYSPIGLIAFPGLVVTRGRVSFWCWVRVFHSGPSGLRIAISYCARLV